MTAIVKAVTNVLLVVAMVYAIFQVADHLTVSEKCAVTPNGSTVCVVN